MVVRERMRIRMVNAGQFDTIFNVPLLYLMYIPLLNNSRYPMLCTYYV